MLIGEDGLKRLSECHVAIFGIGGVGGYVTEALARCGIGEFTLVDKDVVSMSNLNRQIIALESTWWLSTLLHIYKTSCRARRKAP